MLSIGEDSCLCLGQGAPRGEAGHASSRPRGGTGHCVGYLAAAGVVVNDLSGDGRVHVREEHLGVAVRGHAAVHHHEGALHRLPPPGVVFLRGREEGQGPLGTQGCPARPSGGAAAESPNAPTTVSGCLGLCLGAWHWSRMHQGTCFHLG